MNKKQQKRAYVVERILQQAQYQKACKWCPIVFPGKEPNIVNVKQPQSDGMCKQCYEEMVRENNTEDNTIKE